jgi:hypothetical protein
LPEISHSSIAVYHKTVAVEKERPVALPPAPSFTPSKKMRIKADAESLLISAFLFSISV